MEKVISGEKREEKMPEITKYKIAKWTDLFVLIIILILFIYDTFFNKVSSKTVWVIATILIIISLIIKLIYVGKGNKKSFKEEKNGRHL